MCVSVCVELVNWLPRSIFMEKNGGKIENSGRSEKRWKTRRCSGNDYLLKRKTRMERWMLYVGEREEREGGEEMVGKFVKTRRKEFVGRIKMGKGKGSS